MEERKEQNERDGSGLSEGKRHHKFSDFSEEVPKLEGEKMSIEDIFGKETLILNYSIRDSKFKEGTYLTLQFELKGAVYVTFTSSKVLQNQMVKYDDNIPFYATIIRKGRYFTLS